MKIYGCQFDIAWEDKAANFQKVRALLSAAKPERDSLIFLPEMFATGFSMNVAGIAEDRIAGPTVQFLAACRKNLGIYLAGGFVSRAKDGKGRNELAVFAPDGARVGDYSKIHPFSFGEESQHYAGGTSIARFSWAGTKVSPFICYDLRFPEVFRLTTRDGAEVLAVIANWPDTREAHWITLLQARAIENQTYIVGVNRCGKDSKFSYSGHSLIIDPRGKIIADAGTGENVIGADIDLPALRAYRAQFPALQDMRSEFFGTSGA